MNAFSAVLLAGATSLLVISAPLHAAETEPDRISCETVASDLNRHMSPRVDAGELVAVLRALNASANRQLPSTFVTKNKAKSAGWRPGRDLWSVPALKGMSIGGDRFANREGKLPDGGRRWREADLDYKGGRRGAKRIVFSDDGRRMVTVDHYRTFTEVPPCR
ncbi:MAG: ribonuclease [Desulfuromonadales bacterium]|nr:MAG: ribonuclease [Desulfuromonadales bacterium]